MLCEFSGKGYSVAFDPLDGSSIVDSNFAVGTIFGVWPGAELKGIKGKDMVCCIVICRLVHQIAMELQPAK